MILFLNLAKIHLSRPVELLRGNNTGEKEPAAKWLMALIGFICLGAGYYLAVTTESPIKAITIFLLAVILVMAGTYLLFTAGSIVILKFLRRRKSFYYRTGNFISISGMLYRMKQNAIGLASICILSTGVLLMIIYYKQISEGYEDQKRFEIMQKVGLSRREVRSSVRRQILMVFFLPLLMAMLHITMAFPMIRRMLLLFGMTNTKLFIGCTAGTVLIFAVVYGLIYLMTARSYYHIVERK